MFRRLAYSITSNDLDATIAEQKSFNESTKKLMEADMRGNEYLFKWSRSEKNPVFHDLLERTLQLTHVRFDGFQKFSTKMREARQQFKAISKEERGIEDVRKQHANVCNRLGRLKKQVDSASKKNDLNKVENLLPELQTVLGQNDIATMHLEESVEKLEIYKVRCVREALRLQGEAYKILANYLLNIGDAQQCLSQLIPDDPPNIAGYNSYNDGPKQSQLVVEEMCRALSTLPPSSDRLESFILVDADVDSKFSPGTSPPPTTDPSIIPAPKSRPPLLPPRPVLPDYMPVYSDSVLDDSDYVAHEDVEAERKRVLHNNSAAANGRPPVARKPKLEAKSSLVTDRYTCPGTGADPEEYVEVTSPPLIPTRSPPPLVPTRSPPPLVPTRSPPLTGRSPSSSPPGMRTRSSGAVNSPSQAAARARANTSGYQDPADAYLRVWVKSKGEATAPSATCDSSPYQLPLDRLTKEEAVQKLKSQCMPRRSIRRSSSHSPPQPDSKSRSPARPPASTTTGDLSPMERANVSLQSTLRRTDISLNRSEQLQASLSLSHGDDEDGADAKWLDPEDVMDNDSPAPNEACMTKQSSSSLRRSRSLDDEIPAAVATDVLDLPASRKRSSALSHCRTNSGGGSPIPAHRILCRSRTSSSVGGSPLMDRKRISVADA